MHLLMWMEHNGADKAVRITKYTPVKNDAKSLSLAADMRNRAQRNSGLAQAADSCSCH